MDITERVGRNERTFQLMGRFDAHQVPGFKVALASVAGPFGRVVLDFAGVTFIDSTGLAALVALYKRARAEGGSLSIVNLQDPVRAIFEITQLHTVLPLDCA